LLTTVAVLLAIGSTSLICTAGSFAAGGAWIFCTVVGTLAFLIIGGRQRVFLTAVFSLVQYVGMGTWTTVTVFREWGQPWARVLTEVMIVCLFTFLLGVAVPIAVAWVVTWLDSR
jgi:hypothetical protein